MLYLSKTLKIRHYQDGQADILSRIELITSIVLSSRVTNYKNDIHKFL